MNKLLVFLRQVYFPYRAEYNNSSTHPVVIANTEEKPETEAPVLHPTVDLVARVIGLILAAFGTATIGGLTLGEWFDNVRLIVCS